MNESVTEAWNSYWTQKLEDPFWRHVMQIGHPARILTDQLDLLRERQVRRILLPGNGCSWLPHILVYLGFDVTVVDISSVANDSVATAQLSPRMLADFLFVYKRDPDSSRRNHWVRDDEATAQRVAREVAPGGKLSLVTADIQDWNPSEPFDVIYDDRLAMLLPPEDLPALALDYSHWLDACGICILHTINMNTAARLPLESAFMAAGFQKQDFRPKSTVPPSRSGLFSGFRKQPALPTPVARPTTKDIYFIHGSG